VWGATNPKIPHRLWVFRDRHRKVTPNKGGRGGHSQIREAKKGIRPVCHQHIHEKLQTTLEASFKRALLKNRLGHEAGGTNLLRGGKNSSRTSFPGQDREKSQKRGGGVPKTVSQNRKNAREGLCR